jgi:hypothetical protein
MIRRTRLTLVVIWLTSLVAVASVARSQALQFDPLPEPIVLSGSDIGFRVEGRAGAIPSGRFVVRMGGQWVEPHVGYTRPAR